MGHPEAPHEASVPVGIPINKASPHNAVGAKDINRFMSDSIGGLEIGAGEIIGEGDGCGDMAFCRSARGFKLCYHFFYNGRC